MTTAQAWPALEQSTFRTNYENSLSIESSEMRVIEPGDGKLEKIEEIDAV